jgi:hypothetical protein
MALKDIILLEWQQRDSHFIKAKVPSHRLTDLMFCLTLVRTNCISSCAEVQEDLAVQVAVSASRDEMCIIRK